MRARAGAASSGGSISLVKHVQVDCRRVVHHSGIVLTREDVSGASHIRGKLADQVDAAQNLGHDTGIAEVADDEFLSRAVRKLLIFEVNAPHPEALALQSSYQMTADEFTGAANQHFRHCSTHGFPPEFCLSPANTNPVLT
jgi:hypothetical protein